MALKTTEFKVADYLTEPVDVYHYLEAELEEYEPKYLALALEEVAEARGGVDKLSSESGIPVSELAHPASLGDAAALAIAHRLMEVYRPEDSSASSGVTHSPSKSAVVGRELV